MKLGVLISGRGSNLEALLTAKSAGRLPLADFAVVLSNTPDARGLSVAESHGVPTCVVDSAEYRGRREHHDAAVVEALTVRGCEAVILAGYMRIVGPRFLQAFPHRIVNIHPSLLPSFPGLDAQRQALEHGVRVTGCTVHLVDEGTDTGPIILQKFVDVKSDDTEDTLSARILEQEHIAIVEAVALLTENRLHVKGRRVMILPEPGGSG